MNEQQRETAAVQGYIAEHVIVTPDEAAAGASEHVLYTVRISIKGDDPGVTLTPEPPSNRERERVLLEAHRLLERRRTRATLGADGQMLTQALICVTHEIDALL